MSLKSDACDHRQIEDFVAHRLSETDQAVLEQHLATCAQCRRELDQMVAPDQQWQKAGVYLRDEDGDLRSLSHLSSSADGLKFGAMRSDRVTELLAPSDDPQYLGRLGEYEISGVVGCGGMGAVLKGFDRALNRVVAIKVMAPHLASSGAARQRFAREAQAAAAITHDNVIDIYGVAEANGLPYLVMPYSRGMSLQKRIDKEGTLPTLEVLRIGHQIAAGLAAAHGQGLVHRDIKPANILLNDGVDRLQITDFGLARAVDDASVTKTGVIAGTPHYMSPEQARGDAIDHRSDLFSLGSVLYTCCTGHPPFRAESAYGILRRITDNEPRPIREINPDIPDWLCAIIERLHKKSPDDRFQSANEVAYLLKQCISHLQTPSTPLPEEILSLSLARQPRSLRARVVTAAIALFGVVFCGVFAMNATDSPDISGHWLSQEWGKIELRSTDDGRYEGTFHKVIATDNTPQSEVGKLELKWSRLERRFNGTWREDNDHFGKLSLRLVDAEIHGGWTTSTKANRDEQHPRLADLVWERAASSVESDVAETGTANPVDLAAHGMLGGWNKTGAIDTPRSLGDVVNEFNRSEKAIIENNEWNRPHLTVDEVISSVRWRLKNPEGTAANILDGLKFIRREWKLPPNWSITGGVSIDQFRGITIGVWRTELLAPANGTQEQRALLIRERYLSAPMANLTPQKQPDQSKGKSLAAAIDEFNQSQLWSDGEEQLPLSINEVVAAILHSQFRRDDHANVDEETFQQYQKIALTHWLPEGAKLERITSFGTGPTDSHQIFSVRIRLRQIAHPERTYAFIIRDQHLSYTFGRPDIAWGKPAENGMQVGLRLQPNNPEYTIGQTIKAEVMCRTITGRSLDATVPNFFTASGLEFTDADGDKLYFEAKSAPMPIAGGMVVQIGEAPHSLGKVPLRIGNSTDRVSLDSELPHGSSWYQLRQPSWGDPHAILFAAPDQPCRLSLQTSNFEGGEAISTGAIEFKVVEPDPSPSSLSRTDDSETRWIDPTTPSVSELLETSRALAEESLDFFGRRGLGDSEIGSIEEDTGSSLHQ
ncbi:MAG: protein kinase [Pirellulaceae bacterium]